MLDFVRPFVAPFRVGRCLNTGAKLANEPHKTNWVPTGDSLTTAHMRESTESPLAKAVTSEHLRATLAKPETPTAVPQQQAPAEPLDKSTEAGKASS